MKSILVVVGLSIISLSARANCFHRQQVTYEDIADMSDFVKCDGIELSNAYSLAENAFNNAKDSQAKTEARSILAVLQSENVYRSLKLNISAKHK